MIAGVVALLPVAGLALGFVWIEGQLAATWKSVPSIRDWYFPGLGVLAACVVIYAVGLVVSTFLGRFVWGLVDRLLDSLPLLGPLYRTLKQILGYGEGRDALFERVVWVRSREHDSEELGLVTRELGSGQGLLVFVPGSPNPASGRLLHAHEAVLRPAGISVHEALKTLVALGKVDIANEALLDASRGGTSPTSEA